MVFLFFPIFLPLLIGFFIIRCLLNFQVVRGAHLLLEISLAWGLGMGISSVLAFFWLIVFKSWNQGLMILELSIFLVVLLLATYLKSSRARQTLQLASSLSPAKDSLLLVISFYLFLIYALFMFLILVYINPHGRWDAWYIWNVRARFLYRAKDWIDAFSPLLAHSDYPPLLPLNIARCWFQIKQETIVVPALLSLLFTFGSVGIIVSSFFIICDRIKGYLAGLILMGTPFFIFLGADQIADNPLAFYFLATMVLFYLYDMDQKIGVGLLVLAGTMAGFSGWTKNEGLLFIIAIPLARLFVPKQPWGTYGKTMIFFLMGIFPILFTIIIFKSYIAPPNDLWGHQGLDTLFKNLVDLTRYLQIGKAFGLTLYNFGYWPSISLNLLLIIYGYMFGFSWVRLRGDLLSLLALFLIMFSGYFFVFVFSPQDLSWHLRTALERLFLQFWPSFLFIYFLLMPSPSSTENPASNF